MWEVFSKEYNTHVQYESPITSGLKVMAKIKAFVHAHVDARAMTLAPRTYLPRLTNKLLHLPWKTNEAKKLCVLSLFSYNTYTKFFLTHPTSYWL